MWLSDSLTRRLSNASRRFRSARCLGSSIRSNLDTSVSGATGEGRTDCNPELPGGTVEVERDKTPGAVRGARLRRGRTSRIISDAVFCVRSKSKTSGGGGAWDLSILFRTCLVVDAKRDQWGNEITSERKNKTKRGNERYYPGEHAITPAASEKMHFHVAPANRVEKNKVAKKWEPRVSREKRARMRSKGRRTAPQMRMRPQAKKENMNPSNENETTSKNREHEEKQRLGRWLNTWLW